MELTVVRPGWDRPPAECGVQRDADEIGIERWPVASRFGVIWTVSACDSAGPKLRTQPL